MPREKISAEEKVEAAKACAEGRISKSEAARRLKVDESTIRGWVARYKANGASAFLKLGHNTVYSEELKLRAVTEYLAGKGSPNDIMARYGFRSTRQLQEWIKVYNSGENFEHKMSGGSRMKQGRETTLKERIEIAKDCIKNGENYGKTAIKFNVSYQQVYTWVKKFKEYGEKGLEDRRGKRTPIQEPRTELEEMKVKMAQLEHENYMLRMERDLLKKVEELERRDRFQK